jgi:Transcription factor zinc-finger
MKKEKNRSGELKFDEKANEEGYFALKEHERIEEMKAEFHKTENARREALAVSCPKCPGNLEKNSFMGFVVERCDICEGIWLSKDQLHGIVRQATRGRLGGFFDRCFAKEGTL